MQKADAPAATAAQTGAASDSPEPEFNELLEAFNCEHDVEVLPDGTIITRVAHPIKPTVTREIPIETIRAAIQVAREIDPALADRLAALCNKDSKQCEQMLRSSGQRLVALAELKQRDPQLYSAKLGELQHELQIKKLSVDYRRAVAAGDTTQADVILQQLRAVLQVQLLMSIKTRGEYICRLEEQIQKAKDELAHDAARFAQVVNERLDELTRAAAKPASATQSPVAAKPKPNTSTAPVQSEATPH
jgi:hypothetical protein